MGFAWKFLFPVAMLNLLVTGLLVALVLADMDVILFLIFAVIAVVCAHQRGGADASHLERRSR